MTTPGTRKDSDPDLEPGAELLARFLEQRDRGERPDPGRFAAEHPEHAEAFLEALSGFEEVESALVEDGPPRVLGEYRLLREVGRGGMGIVFEAEQVGLGRRVALKLLPAASMLDKSQVRRFELESRAAAMLDHSHIVPVYGVGVAQGMHYYAMRFVDGTDLGTVMRSARSFAAESADRLQAYCRDLARESDRRTTPVSGRAWLRLVAGWVADAAEAVEHSHRLGVLHRDLKPGNLMLDRDGHLWVTDFGLAQLQGGDGDLTHTGDLIGTLAYCSPEQAAGRRADVGVRSDVYALGVTLYQLATFELPFADNDRSALLRRILHDEPPRPRRHNPAIPADLETIIQRSMAKEPADRYASAGEIATDLRAFLDLRPIRARPVTLPGRAWRWCRRHPARSAAWAVTIVAVTVGAVVGFAAREAMRQRDAAQRAEARSEMYRELARAQALARSGGPGQQRESLAGVRRASRLLAGLPPAAESRATLLELRATAVEAMSRWDAELHGIELPETPVFASFGPNWERLAVSFASGRVGVFEWPSGAFEAWLNLAEEPAYLGWLDRHHVAARWGVEHRVADRRSGELALPPPPESAHATVGFGSRLLAFAGEGRTWWGDPVSKTWSLGPVIPPEIAAVGRVTHALPMRDGRRVMLRAGSDEDIWIWWPESSRAVPIPRAQGASAVDGTADDATVAFGFLRGEVCLARSADANARDPAAPAHASAVTHLAFGRGDALLASSGWDHAVQLRDARDLTLLLQINAASGDLRIREDDAGVVWLGAFQDGRDNRAFAWQLLPPPALHRMVAMPWPAGSVLSAALHPGGQIIAMTTGDGVVFFDLRRGALVTHKRIVEPRYLDFTPDGRQLLCGSRSGLQRLAVDAVGDELRLGSSEWLLRTENPRDRVQGCLSASGRHYYAQHGAGIEELELSSGRRRRFEGTVPGAIQPAASADGRWVATGSWGGLNVAVHACIWDVHTGRLVERVPSRGRAKVAFSPDSQRLVVALSTEVLVLTAGTWEIERRWEREWKGDHPGEIAFTPDGELLALTQRERCILRSTADWSVELDFALDGNGGIQRVRIGPRGRYLFGPSAARVLQVWDLAAIRAELGF